MFRFAHSLTAAALALAVTAAPAPGFDLESMTDAERSALRAEIRAYLLDNPEIIIEAIDVLESRKAADQARTDKDLVAAFADQLFNDGFSWVGGNPDGDITLVEFIDYRCGYCRRAAPEIEQLLTFDDNIRLVIKEFPILGDASVISSRFAVATQQIAGNDAYKQVHDALIGLRADPSEVVLRRLADGLGLDSDAIIDHMNSDDVTQVIATNRALGQQLQINGTPTFVLQDQLLRGYLPYDQLSALVDEKRG